MLARARSILVAGQCWAPRHTLKHTSLRMAAQQEVHTVQSSPWAVRLLTDEVVDFQLGQVSTSFS